LVIGYLPITAGALPIGFARRMMIGSILLVIGDLPIRVLA
jgi:hypothetical protein